MAYVNNKGIARKMGDTHLKCNTTMRAQLVIKFT